jgi:hypothetical protein
MPAPRNPMPTKHGRDHRPGGADPIPGIHSARMPWIFLDTDITGVTVNAGADDPITHDGLFTAPFNRGGTLDEDVFGFSGSSTTVDIKQGGLYLCQALVAWFTSWTGGAFTYVDIANTGPAFPAFPTLKIWEDYNSQEGRAHTTVGFSQVLLTARTVFVVDADATGVTVTQKLYNNTGTNRTYASASPNPNIAHLTIIRLSPTGESNPAAI